MHVEGFVKKLNKRMATRKEEVPLGIKCLLKRVDCQTSIISNGDITCIEKHLNIAFDNINGTAAKHGALGGLVPISQCPTMVIFRIKS